MAPFPLYCLVSWIAVAFIWPSSNKNFTVYFFPLHVDLLLFFSSAAFLMVRIIVFNCNWLSCHWIQWILQEPFKETSWNNVMHSFRCFGDMRTSGGPIVSFFYSLFPVVIAGIITVCYMGVWITIQVTIWAIIQLRIFSFSIIKIYCCLHLGCITFQHTDNKNAFQ